MMKYPDGFATESGEMPVEVRNALLDILFHALCCIRAFADNGDACHAVADHTHNLPVLLQHQNPGLLVDYCQAIPDFKRQMELLGQNVSIFDPAWRIIQEYERVKIQPLA